MLESCDTPGDIRASRYAEACYTILFNRLSYKHLIVLKLTLISISAILLIEIGRDFPYRCAYYRCFQTI
jgi:hypothetical protein